MIRPPRFASWLVSNILSKELYEDIAGDMVEEFQANVQSKGKVRANLIYFLEAFRYVRMYRGGRKFQSSNSISMFQNYFKIAFRNLFKHKAYSIINISGLGIGLACVFLIFLFIRIETSYDKFHENGQDIYRLQHVYGFINALAAPTYERDYPEVINSIRIHPWKTESKVTLANQEVYFQDILMADSNFFSFFSFPLIQGDPMSCLLNKNSVVISASTARKYFGESDPIGQPMKIDGVLRGVERSFTVAAVFEDVPFNSHLQFDMVVPFELLYDDPTINILEQWPNDWIGNYVQLSPGTDPQMMADKYLEMWNKYYNAEDTARYMDFMPLEDLYLNSYHLRTDYAEHGNANQVRIFSAIAVIILLIACINFMNLATARSSKRAKEVGVRKVMGAFRKQLIMQFFSESAIMTFMALILATLILVIVIPPAGRLAEIDLMIALKDFLPVAVMILVLAMITIVIAGSYPALFLSSFQPISVLAGKVNKKGGRGSIRRVLVIFQFTISIVLIIGAMVVYNQMQFVKNKDLGFQPEDVVVMKFGSPTALRQSWDRARSEIEQLPGVTSVMASRQVPGDNAYYWGYKFEGVDAEKYEYPHGDAWLGYYVGINTLDALGVELLMGRTFSEEIPTDSNAYILNESGWKLAMELYGEDWKEPIGRSIEYYTTHSGDWGMDKKGVVIGVVKDFHHHSLQRPIDPLIIHNTHSESILVKVLPEQTNSVIASLEQRWPEWQASLPFNYEFLDDKFNEYYKVEEQLNSFILIFCLLAIGIACLGLYGLSSFVAEQRTKEIGIRKVLGASEHKIVKMLSSDFLKLVGIAIVLAIPTTIYFMTKWLDNFAYRIDLSWYFFVVGSVVAVIIAIITVSYHSIRAATSNPVNSLRIE